MLRHEEVARADCGHEQRGEERDEARTPFFHKIYRGRPKHKDGERLIGPAEITPNDVEPVFVLYLPQQEHDGGGKERQAYLQALGDGTLGKVEEVGNDEARTAECRVAARNRRGHDAQNCQDAARNAEPVLANQRHDGGRGGVEALVARSVNQRVAAFGHIVEEIHCHRGPYQCYEAFGNHCAVEHGAAVPLAVDAPRHERALRGVETAQRTAGNRDEEAGEDLLGETGVGSRAHVVQPVPKFGQLGHLDVEHRHKGYGHEDKGKGKEGIDASDDFVDGQHRGQDVVSEDGKHPDGRLRAAHLPQYQRGGEHEDHAHHKQQEHGEDEHAAACLSSEVASHDFGHARAVVAQGEHAAQVVVHAAGKDAAQHYP